MWGLDTRDVGKKALTRLRIPAPENRDHGAAVERANRSLGDLFPADAAVLPSLAWGYRKHSVEQQHSLVCPGAQVTILPAVDTQIIVQLAVNINQGTRRFHTRASREGHAHGVSWCGIGVLAHDEHADLIQRHAQRAADVLGRGQIVLALKSVRDLWPLLFYYRRQHRFPGRVVGGVHG